jgi:hypothetical protein
MRCNIDPQIQFAFEIAFFRPVISAGGGELRDFRLLVFLSISFLDNVYDARGLLKAVP